MKTAILSAMMLVASSMGYANNASKYGEDQNKVNFENYSDKDYSIEARTRFYLYAVNRYKALHPDKDGIGMYLLKGWLEDAISKSSIDKMMEICEVMDENSQEVIAEAEKAMKDNFN